MSAALENLHEHSQSFAALFREKHLPTDVEIVVGCDDEECEEQECPEIEMSISTSISNKNDQAQEHLLRQRKHGSPGHAYPSKQTFHAHKIILAVQSHFFASSFYNVHMREYEEGRIEIPDIAPNIFEKLLEYIYTGRIESVKPYEVVELCIASDYLGIQGLKTICEDYIDLNPVFTKENIADLLPRIAGLRRTYARAFEFVKNYASQILLDPQISAKLTEDFIISILKCNTIKLTEVDCFRAALTWCKAKLGDDATPQMLAEQFSIFNGAINYMEMTAQEFTDVVYESGALSKEAMLPLLVEVCKANVPRSNLTRFQKNAPTFTLSPNKCHGSLTISNNGRTVRKHSDDQQWGMVSSETGFIEGIHEWTVRIDKSVMSEIMIGVTRKGSRNDKYFIDESQGWGVHCYGGHIYPGTIRFFDERLKVGDVIKVVLNMDNKSMTMYKNGHRRGPVKTNLPQEPLYPAVIMYNIDDQVTIEHLLEAEQ